MYLLKDGGCPKFAYMTQYIYHVDMDNWQTKVLFSILVFIPNSIDNRLKMGGVWWEERQRRRETTTIGDV
jgi:uncharacterized membrane protein